MGIDDDRDTQVGSAYSTFGNIRELSDRSYREKFDRGQGL